MTTSSGSIQAQYAPYRETDAAAGPTFTTFLLVVAAGIVTPALLAYGFATDNEARVVTITLSALCVLGVIARPFFGLILFVGLLYVRPEESIPGLEGLRLTLGISIVTFFVLWLKLAQNREPIVKTPVNYLIIGFGLIAGFSTLNTGITSTAVPEIAKLVILVLLILNLVRTPDAYRIFITAIIIFTTYLALFSIYLYFTGGAMNYEGIIERSQGTGMFGDPNELAATLVAGLALALSRIAGNDRPAQIFYLALSAAIVWATLLTDSRGGMVALLTVFAGWFFAFQKNKTRAAVFAVLIAAPFLVFGPSRMRTFDPSDDSASNRLDYWDNGIRQLMAHPLTGVGYDQFPDLNNGMTAHNSFVICFAELGIAGYFCWMGCIYYNFRRRPEGERLEEESQASRRELLGARLALIGLLSACFWITRTYVAVTYLFLSLPIAQQIAASRTPGIFKLNLKEWCCDGLRICLACVGSILFIEMFVRFGR